MQVELDLSAVGPGRTAKPATVECVRALIPDDLPALREEKGVKPNQILAIRERHHRLAQLLASGHSNNECSAITGYSPSRISILIGDPTFQELIQTYREVRETVFADFQDRAATLTLTALNRLQDKLEDDDGLGTEMILEIAKFGADRTGHAPVSKNVNVNVNTDLAQRLESAKRRVIEAKSSLPPGLKGELS